VTSENAVCNGTPWPSGPTTAGRSHILTQGRRPPDWIQNSRELP
jgi:hypothetical protein